MNLLSQTSEPVTLGTATAVQRAKIEPSPSRWRKVWMPLLAVWLITGIYIVPADQQAVVTRFGAVVEPRVMPGIHIALRYAFYVACRQLAALRVSRFLQAAPVVAAAEASRLNAGAGSRAVLLLRNGIRRALRERDLRGRVVVDESQFGSLAAQFQIAIGKAYARRGGYLIKVDPISVRHQHARDAHVEADDQTLAFEQAHEGVLRRLLLFLARFVGASRERRRDDEHVCQAHESISRND